MLIAARNAVWGGKRKPYDAVVEYLESTGTQWIDTGYKSTPYSRWEVDFKSNKLLGKVFQSIIGGQDNTSFNRLSGIIVSDNTQFRVVVTTAYNLQNGILNGIFFDANIDFYNVYDSQIRHLYGIDVKNRKSYVDNKEITGSDGNCFTNYNVALLARNSSGTISNFASGLLYGFKHWENDELVQHFIPVRFTNENGETEGAMYDRVSGQLFRNAGTGAFVLGSDL
jgi:hypothetical protein